MPARSRFRRKYQISDTEQIILYLGRIEHRKGLDLSLEAFARVSREFLKCVFVVAGPEEDGYREILEEKASKLKVDQKVLFTGYLNPVERLEAFMDADLFILNSYSENFGMAVVEAMASGLPIITANLPGVRGVIEENVNGLLVDINN